ncbi:type-F conjugative transfer system secretin TraK [uncultured Thiodictyon sp.]|uniref:TraK domain-containing protein n=1 Tax=uncultured Thiodictyon sp. TaxID=1846217 RepID=UPI0025F13A0E|nr:type-F conjugative transfer system secretin TraK [uncultured Thiodictyon sp.]
MTHAFPRRLLSALLASLLVGAVKAQPATGIELPAVAPTVLLDGGQQTNTEPPKAPAPPVQPVVPAAVPVPPAIRQVVGQGEVRPAASSAASPAASPPSAARFQRAALGPRPPSGGLELGPRNVSVEPGTTALIEVAIDHLNRIVTPFATPVVHTVSNASTTVDGRVVYLATASEEPVALWITDGSGNETALSLTLAPRHVPPREVRVTVPGYRPKAHAPETSAPSASEGPAASSDGFGAAAYVEGLTDLLRAMAQRRLPTGFQVSKTTPPSVRCLPGLKVLNTQLAEGPSARVVTVGVRNTGSRTIPANESACDVGQVVAAVGAWPLKTLTPGQETEVLLVLQQGSAR